jgi:hypothetical protein
MKAELRLRLLALNSYPVEFSRAGRFRGLEMAQQTLPTLEELFDRYVGIALARQCAFADTVPTPYWEWKYDDDGEVGKVEIPNLGTFQVEFLGSESYVSNTWLAAWANQSVAPSFANASEWLRENCAKLGDVRLGEEYLPLDEMNGDYIGVIATTLLNGSAYIALPVGDGQGMSFQVVFDVPLINFQPTPMNRINTVFQMIEQSTQVTNMMDAINFYLLDEGFEVEDKDTDSGFENIYRDKHGRVITYKFTEAEENGEQVYKVTRSIEAKDDDVAVRPDHFDVTTQWDSFVRAPLSRPLGGFETVEEEQQ